MVKEFSKLSYENLPVSEKDMVLIQSNPSIREYFEKCKLELHEMSRIQFYGLHAFYSLLKIKIKSLAIILKNKDNVARYEENLNKFFYYDYDLKVVFEEAITCRDESEVVFFKLHKIFDQVLPEVVIRTLADFMTLKDLLLIPSN